MTVNVHLNADAPNANDVPTMHNLTFLTLAEYCRVCRLHYDMVRDALDDSEVISGGRGVTFASVGVVASVISQAFGSVPTPITIPHSAWVEIG